jgi:PKD repeat protein
MFLRKLLYLSLFWSPLALAQSVDDMTGANAGSEGTVLSWSCTWGDPDEEVTWTWTYEDGPPDVYVVPAGSGGVSSSSHAFSDNGSHKVTCAAVGEDGGSDDRSETVTVTNVAPGGSIFGLLEVNEGDTPSYTCEASDAGSADTHSYSWTSSDSGTGAGSSFAHQFADNGSFQVTCNVLDDDGGTASTSVSVAVANVAPTLTNTSGTEAGDEASSFAFSASATDPGSDTLTYTWAFGDGATAVGSSASHVYADDGQFTVTLSVCDEDGDCDGETLAVAVANVPPTLLTTSWPAAENEGTALSFSASASDPADTLAYTWDFGDGSSALGASVNHSYVDEGSYNAALTVTDGDGGTASAAAVITVTNASPTVTFTNQTLSGNEGGSFAYAVSVSDPGAADTSTVAWDFGDGQVASGSTVSHVFADDGTYTVAATATDNDGGVSTEAVSVTVGNVTPAISSLTGNASADEGDSVSFAVVATDPGDDTLTYDWDFSDGGVDSGISVAHVFADDGAHSATITVCDDNGACTSSSKSVTVNNANPTITSMTSTASGAEAEVLSFSAVATDPGADTLTYSWDFGDDSPLQAGASVTHAYADDGTYTYSLTVSDEDGGTSIQVGTAGIGNTAPVISLVGDVDGDEGELRVFDAQLVDLGNDPYSCTWNYDDGSSESLVDQDTTDHIYANEGVYDVSVSCVDDGGLSDTASMSVTIGNVAPVVDDLIGDASGSEASLLSFTCATSDVGVDDTLTIDWDYGDGQVETDAAASVSHAYADDAVYEVQCSVSDGLASDSSTISVSVTDVLPSISSFPATLAGSEAEELSFSALASDVAADPLTYAWDFGDGTAATGAEAAHVYADDGTYDYSLTVLDDDGVQVVASGVASISNVAPTVELSVTGDLDEGSLVSFDAVGTDPGADSLTCVWDLGDGTSSTTVDQATASHSFDQDGSFDVSVVCTDDEGDGNTDSLTVDIANVAPHAVSIVADTSGLEGEDLGFACSAEDAGADDALSFAWDFSDGNTASGASVTHSFGNEGTFSVVCTATDDAGAEAMETLAVNIANVAPVIDTIVAPEAADEGEEVNFAAAVTDPGTGEPGAFTWQFGDGSTATGSSVNHTYEDDDDYTVTLVVDDGTDSVSQTVLIEVANLAPTLEAAPITSINEGEDYEVVVSMADDGAADTHEWELAGPSTAVFDEKKGKLTWATDWSDIGVNTFNLSVLDDDGGLAELVWEVEVLIIDADEDGLSDAWEVSNGYDPADPSDVSADDDGDGRTNADEFAYGSDPFTSDAPEAPLAYSPIGEWQLVEVPLNVVNVDSPQGDPLSYAYEVYADEALGTLVTSTSGIPEESDGFTDWMVDVALVENEVYWWRASASDPYIDGPWGEAESFLFNTVNEAPTAPHINLPFDGSTTDTLAAELILDAASDPDGDAITYGIELQSELGETLLLVEALEAEAGMVSLPLDFDLVDGSSYCWFGWATDDEGLTGPDSEVACFAVDLANEAPSAPQIVRPEDGFAVATLLPEVEVGNGIDPEGASTMLLFEVDTDAGFGSENYQFGLVDSDESGFTTWVPEAELEDASTYYLRVLATDGASYSAQDDSTFFVDVGNSIPTAPELLAPEGAVAEVLYLEVSNSYDADDDALFYEFEVRDHQGALVAAATVDEGQGTTRLDVSLTEDGGYSWTARAVDSVGAASAWAPELRFTIEAAPASRPADVKGKGGCKCSSATSGSTVGYLLPMLLLAIRRRSTR